MPSREDAMKFALNNPSSGTLVDLSIFQCSGCVGLSDEHDPVTHAKAKLADRTKAPSLPADVEIRRHDA